MVRLISLACSAVVAAVLVASADAASARPAAATPVPSLTPAATAKLWQAIVGRRGRHRFATAACDPVRAIFYAPTDWMRLATRLAATPSPCAHYYVSVPPLVADKTQLRPGYAAQIRALGPNFHALAEISVNGWTSWVAATGRSWYEAGVEARREMAREGYDVAAGDTWALNELSSAVRAGTGNARANMRAFLNGLRDGDGGPAVRGVVWTAGIGQGTAELSVYQARLQDWYEDEAFWSDVVGATSDWSQEVYGDVRNYAAPGVAREARRDALNEYLQHQSTLAGVAPPSAPSAKTLLAGTSAALANAAWQYDAAFGWTNVPVELMQDYVSAQTYALRAAGTGRFGFAWSPKNLVGMPTTDFNSQTDSLLVRLAASIADSDEAPEGACGASWCTRELDGAALTAAWRTFATWKPSRLAFTSAPQELAPGAASAPVSIALQTSSGVAYTAGVPVAVELTSSSPTAELASGPDGPWSPTLTSTIASGAGTAAFHVRDASSGSFTLTAAAAGKTAGTQAVTVAAAPVPPPPAPAPAPAPAPPAPPPAGGGGGGGAAPDISVAADAAPTAPTVGAPLTYTVRVRNHAGQASRVLLHARLPAQVDFVASEADRGRGCTSAAPATLVCDLDFLAGDLVATVRIHTRVREAGTLTFAASSASEPPDSLPSNDAVQLATTVAVPELAAAANDSVPVLRAVARATVTRRAGVATIRFRFGVSEPARLSARVTSLRSTKPLALLRGSSFAGTRTATAKPVATASARRAGSYVLAARLPAQKLVRGRAYLLRITAVDAGGKRRQLTVRVRA